MSELILCKGTICPDLGRVTIRNYPLGNFGVLSNQTCEYFWGDEDKNDIWTMDIVEHKAFDDTLTEALAQMNNGVPFEETEIYKLLKQLLDYEIEIVMWYCDFYDDIPVVYSEADFFKAVFEGITDKSGMCEVYVRYKHKKD